MPTFQEVAGDDSSATRYRTIAALRDLGPLSRAELARRTALAPSTITAVVKVLADEGVVVEPKPGDRPMPVDQPAARKPVRGREVAVNPRLGAVVGVDFGFRTVRLLVTDLAARELAHAERRLPDHYSSKDGLDAVAELLATAIIDGGIERTDLLAAGVALPGPVDTVHQRVPASSILPGWGDVTAAQVAERLGVRSVIENDANLAALGEHHFGAGVGTSDSITVKFHSGIGGGLIVGDRLVTGRFGGAGEIGHIPVDHRGPLCRCGKRGCLDTYAAVPAILDSMSAVHPGIQLDGFIELVRSHDSGAERVARDAADLVGEAVGNAMLLLAPERIIVVGALARVGDLVLDPIRAALARLALPETSSLPEVTLGRLGDRHTAMGAVALALQATEWLPRGDR